MNNKFKRIIPLFSAAVILFGTIFSIYSMVASTSVSAAGSSLIVESYRVTTFKDNKDTPISYIYPKTGGLKILVNVIDTNTTYTEDFFATTEITASIDAGAGNFVQADNGTVEIKSGVKYGDYIKYTLIFDALQYKGGGDKLAFNVVYSAVPSKADPKADAAAVQVDTAVVNEVTSVKLGTEDPVIPEKDNLVRSGSVAIYECVVNPVTNSTKDDDDDDDESSSSTISDPAPATPHIIVNQYNYGGSEVIAGSDFQLKIKFTNTSKRLWAENIVMTVTTPEAFTLKDSSNSFYMESLKYGAVKEQILNLSVKAGAEPISQAIGIKFTFESIVDGERKQFTSEESISIPIAQIDRFAVMPVEMPPNIMVGDEYPVSLKFLNKGRTEVYNISAEINGAIAEPGQNQYYGNLAAGKEATLDFLVSPAQPGLVSGEFVVSYEDANMNIKQVTMPYTFTGEEMMMGKGDMEMVDPNMPVDGIPEEGFVWTPLYIGLAIGGGVVLLIIVTIIVKKIIAKKAEADDEDL